MFGAWFTCRKVDILSQNRTLTAKAHEQRTRLLAVRRSFGEDMGGVPNSTKCHNGATQHGILLVQMWVPTEYYTMDGCGFEWGTPPTRLVDINPHLNDVHQRAPHKTSPPFVCAFDSRHSGDLHGLCGDARDLGREPRTSSSASQSKSEGLSIPNRGEPQRAL